MRQVVTALAILCLGLGPLMVGGCGDDDEEDEGPSGSPDNTGQSCESADQCFPDVKGDLQGTAVCLDTIDEGYCTHTCQSDDDCCAAEGECKTELPHLCAPFESQGQHCFLSCEGSVLGGRDEQEYCQTEVSPNFICRASGGGAPRKICVPADCDVGESCAGDADCADGLTCLTELKGGYCGSKGCSTNAECPADSACVQHGDSSYCFKTCQSEFDCSVCRDGKVPGTCRSDVTFVEAGTSGSVCVPPS